MTGALALLCLALLSPSVYSAPQPNPQRNNAAGYDVTHLDIRDAILSLVSVLRDQMDKLERHEVRERQLGEQLTRSLATLEKRGRGEEKNIENIASYIARIDEKVKFAQQTLEKQSDERKVDSDRSRSDLEGLRQFISQNAGGSQSLERKLDALAEKVAQLKENGERNTEKFDTLMELWKATSTGSGSSGGGGGGSSDETLMSELAEIKDSISRVLEMDGLGQSGKTGNGNTEWQSEIVESLDSQRKQLAVLEEEIGKALGMLGDVTKFTGSMSDIVTTLDDSTKKGFEALDSLLGPNSSSSLNDRLHTIQEILQLGQKQIEDKVRDTETALEGLYSKVDADYKHLAHEMKGLANVESVLLDTGDSVLDTKRRLEYGVQQIMGEVNNQLSHYTGNLNTSLQQRFDGLANAVLANQSVALTNLTSRMEEEISQVWRQIGILYHQMSRSANILDEIHSQTSQYVNNSLDTMSSMDGKVGQITNQMGEVDDNLNYLLGRMSLVVQEFNMIKGGLGDALVNLKQSFEEIGGLERKPDAESISDNPGASETPNEI